MTTTTEELIVSRLKKTFEPTHLEVIDESGAHKGHAGYGGGGRHFAIIIAAPKLSELTRLQAHREIYAVLTDLMQDEIHALRITVQTP